MYHLEYVNKVQLNKYETDQYFLQNFQCTTMLIHEFCKICDREIVLQECKSKQKQLQVPNSYKTRKNSNNLLYNFGKIKEKYGLVLYSFKGQ
jgi:hypothetical protein